MNTKKTASRKPKNKSASKTTNKQTNRSTNTKNQSRSTGTRKSAPKRVSAKSTGKRTTKKPVTKTVHPVTLAFRNLIRLILALLGILVLASLLYLFYVLLSYNRIADNTALNIKSNAQYEQVEPSTEYTISTYNLGFGAYTPDFTFFMDGGSQSWANSKDSVKHCIKSAGKTALKYEPDFALFQEVDTDSTRSYHVNENAMLQKMFKGYCEAFAVNYHSAFLFYPIQQPHGKSNSGIATFSKYNIKSSTRKKLEVSTTFSKFLDLDRCYSVSRIPTSNHHELVVYNIHSSAYEKDASIRDKQMEKLFADMQEEYDKGNYCVCGGDFNHDFTGDSAKGLNPNAETHSWAKPFPDEMLPENIKKITCYNEENLISTSRNCDVPYSKDSFTIILDGYLVSDNVEVTSLDNIDTAYEYSDHNPVVMKFKLADKK